MAIIMALGGLTLIIGFVLGDMAEDCAYERGYDAGIEDVLKMLPEDILEVLAREEGAEA